MIIKFKEALDAETFQALSNYIFSADCKVQTYRHDGVKMRKNDELVHVAQFKSINPKVTNRDDLASKFEISIELQEELPTKFIEHRREDDCMETVDPKFLVEIYKIVHKLKDTAPSA